MLYTGFKCPIVVGAPIKPINRGIKLFVLIDYETRIIVDFKVRDGLITTKMVAKFPGRVVGMYVDRLLSWWLREFLGQLLFDCGHRKASADARYRTCAV